MSDDFISIVLAVYNGERYLKEQMDSILTQVNVSINELIVIDDCSIDNSYNIIQEYKNVHGCIRLIRNEFNIGPIGAFIKGAKLSTNNYIAFADQDDIWKKDKLEKSIKLIKELHHLNKPSVVFTDLELINESGNHVHSSFWNLHNIKPYRNNFFTILFGNIVTGCTMVIDRKMLNEFIAMPVNAEMHDHWIALIATSFGAWKFSEEKTVLYRIHEKSVTDKKKVSLKDIFINFLTVSFSKNPLYLKAYIHQAILFKQQYQSILDAHTNSQLDYFINVQKSPGLVRKFKSKFRFLLSKWV